MTADADIRDATRLDALMAQRFAVDYGLTPEIRPPKKR
jgi:hypothetical protein